MATRLLLVLATLLGVALSAAVPAQAETITGTFTFDDTDPSGGIVLPFVRPIAGARVDVWSCFPNASGACNGWGFETTTTTSPVGSISVSLTRPPGTRYGLRVHAQNSAALVVPSVPASGTILTPFFQKPGLPAGPEITRDVAAPTDVLDFSFRFADAYSASHFNVADTLRLARVYANANRDPGETDLIPVVRVTPDPTWLGTAFYNVVHKTMVLTPADMNEDHTLLHEYGHVLEDSISHFLALPSLHDGCTARSLVDPAGILSPINSPEHAWMEGFADWFAAVVADRTPGRFFGNRGIMTPSRVETPSLATPLLPGCATTRAAFNGESIELDVAATLFDAFDPLNLLAINESSDRLEGFDTQIFQIFDRELDGPVAPEIHAFRDAWLARGLPASAFGRLFVLNGIRFRRNYPPIAQAGPDAVVYEGSTVTLDASSSEDPETSVLGFGWAQTGGPPVALSNNNLSSTTFTAPTVGPAGTTLTFLLRVSDVTFAGSTDTVTVTVRDWPGAPTLAPAVLDFGLTGARKVLTATLTNGGPGPLGVGSKAVTGSSSFGYETSTCGSQLPAGASCTVSVGFTPPPSGAVTGTLTVYTSNSPAGSVSIDLRGRGGIPKAELDRTALHFGPVNVGAAWSERVRLTNTGAVPVTVSSVTISGGGGFSHTGCPSILQPGAACDVTVTFAPTTAGPHSALLRFQDDGGSPHDVALDGTGSPVGAPVAYPSPSSFGAIGLGASTGAKTFHLVNTGGATFAVVQVSVLGHFAEFPITSDACTGLVLPPGGHCWVTVAFSPQATGARAGTLSFATTSGAASVLLDGTGVGKPVPGAWPQFAAGTSRSGFAPDETALEAAAAAALRVAWELPLKAEAHSSPAVVDGVAYLGVEDGTVYAVDIVKQSVLWSFATGGAVRSSPAVEGGVVYVGSRDGTVVALDAARGTPLWSFAAKGPVDSSPAVSGGVLVVGSDDGSVYALDAASGALLWSDTLGAPVRSAPAIDGAVAYAAADNGRVRAYELAKGTILWTAFVNGAASGVTVSHGAVYVGSSGSNLYAFDSRSGAQRWAFAAGGPFVSAPAAAYGLVYAGSDDGSLYALEERTGQVVWALPIGAPTAAVALANGVVYAVTTDGFVHAVDAWAQRELGVVEAKALSSAAVVDGAVYVGTAGGLAELRP